MLASFQGCWLLVKQLAHGEPGSATIGSNQTQNQRQRQTPLPVRSRLIRKKGPFSWIPANPLKTNRKSTAGKFQEKLSPVECPCR